MQNESRNLFEAVSKYLPTIGEVQKRDPKEDFCTESLAYLLSHDARLLEGFVRLFGFGSPDAQFEVHTQHIHEDLNGRIDLVLRSLDGSRTIAIESKFSAPLRERQLEDYNAWTKGHAALLAPQQYLSRHRDFLKNIDVKSTSWELVQNLLSTLAKPKSGGTDLVNEFASFLSQRGYQYCAMTQNPSRVSSVQDFVGMMDEWAPFMRQLRERLGLRQAGQFLEPRWNEKTAGSDCSYFGVYGPQNSYAGFEFKGEIVSCIYQETFLGPTTKVRLPANVLVEPDEQFQWITAREAFPNNAGAKTELINEIFDRIRHLVIESGADMGLVRRLVTETLE